MPALRTTAFAALVLALLVVPAAAGHAAPKPSDKETRLLADWGDDCGGDGGAAAGSCRGSHDLLALDVQEVHDEELGDAVVFRLYADKGQAGSRKDVVSVETPAGRKTFTFQTGDDVRFTNGGGFDEVSNAVPINDGTRFYVEGRVRLSALGTVAEKVSGFKVEAYAGSSIGDFMPGGCNNTVGSCIDTGGSGEQYVRPEYALRGPSYYVRLDVPPQPVDVAAGAEEIAELRVTSLVNEPQRVHLTLDGAEGAEAHFHNPADPSGTGYSDEGQVDLPGKATSVLHLALSGVTAGSKGVITVTVTTDAGGYAQRSVAYEVTEAGTGTCQSGMHGMTGMHPCPTSSSSTSKGSPTPALAMVALAFLAAASRRS